MKNKKPETIADLDISLIFERRYVRYEDFIINFISNNHGLKNFTIKPNNYIFEIIINNELFSFKIFILENDNGIYENKLNDLMFQLYMEITTLIYENNIFDDFVLKNFEMKDSRTFIVKYEILPFILK